MTGVIITVPSDQWVSVNDLSGISVGNEYSVMNRGTSDVMIIKGDEPDSDSTDGVIMTSKDGLYAFWTFTSSDDEVWMKAYDKNELVYVFD